MKFLGWVLAVLAASLCLAGAQVIVEITLEQEQFLVGEKLPVAVRITNHSGQTLNFGEQPDWLSFMIEEADGTVVRKLQEVPVLGKFTLESSMVATRRVELSKCFELSKSGSYRIIASVRIKEWKQELASPARRFDIIEGSRIWTQDFGVPLPPGATNTTPEVRNYTLQQANFLRSQVRLYVRLSDVSRNKVLKVIPISPMVTFGSPQAQLDAENNLHLLNQTGARRFVYVVVSPNGDVLLRQTYDYDRTRPRLIADEKGRFSVLGGARKLAPDDYPPPISEQNDTANP